MTAMKWIAFYIVYMPVVISFQRENYNNIFGLVYHARLNDESRQGTYFYVRRFV